MPRGDGTGPPAGGGSEQAVVNSEACSGCAACVSECPNEAIILVQKKISK